MKSVKSALFFTPIALLAGVVAGITAFLLWSVFDVRIPRCLKLFLPSSIGLCVGLGVEGVLRGESLKGIVLRIAPAIIGLSIAYHLICVTGL